MKGKITKDILLRVGKGVMRVPRNPNVLRNKHKPVAPSKHISDIKKQLSNHS